jgi:acyl-CoA reductase-like NAD-dependent aldehyde dehydrogenase
MVTFTGSAAVGWRIRERAPKKKVSLELGNNAPLIVHKDGDWKTAADKAKTAGFSHAGQSCISTQRIYVHESIADAFSERLVSEVSKLNLGDPSLEATDVSALIDPGEADRVESWIKEAETEGAAVLTGGKREGRLLEPTVLADITPDMKVSRLEVFGPVVGLASYEDLNEALRLADDSAYGLQAAIFTRDIDTALHAADRLHYGGVLINEMPTWRADQMPYGGDRDSGNTREGPAWAARSMTEEQLIVIRQGPAPTA